MNDNLMKMPIDARLLSYAIIELNICRHNVGIYPKEHPAVDKSMDRALNFLRKLFEFRPEITFAIAKDLIIIDKYNLDKKNPVFKDFAINLCKMNVSYVTFKKGLSKDELYKFNLFLLQKTENFSVEKINEDYKKYNFKYINVGFVDYRLFSSVREGGHFDTQRSSLWEKYVQKLIEGKLNSGEVADEVREIPPDILATLINNKIKDMKEETYDRVITAYLRSSTENTFSEHDLKKVLKFIDSLAPELKKRFLSSTLKTLTKEIDTTSKALTRFSSEEMLSLISTISEYRVNIPSSLVSLLDKLSLNSHDEVETIYIDEEDLDADKILFSDDFSALLETNDEEMVKSKKADDIQLQSLMNYEAAELKTSHLIDFENEFSEDIVDRRFNQIVIDLMSSSLISEKDYPTLIDILRNQTEYMLWTGEYKLMQHAIEVIKSNRDRFSQMSQNILEHFYSPAFITQLVKSFRMLGKEKRKEIFDICVYYDKEIIPYLIDALAEEDSMSIRRFLLDVLKQFGDKIVHETIKRLHDGRWFVKRNMLYLLGETDCREVIEYIRPYCRDENPKVSVAALKCLLNVGDTFAIDIIKEYLSSNERGKIEQAIVLSGSYKIKEVVSDLVNLLRKKAFPMVDLENKIPIIKALGEIGDPEAIDALSELVSTKSLFFVETVERIKEEIYKTLKNYPYQSIKDLVERGIKSKNNIIKEECIKIINTRTR